MSYRVRFTMPDGRTGLWMRDYATREEAQRAIDDRHGASGLAYSVEEVATPEARIRELEAELAQLRVHYDVANREVDHLRDAYDAARQDLDVAKRNVARLESTLAASRQGPAKASQAHGDTP